MHAATPTKQALTAIQATVLLQQEWETTATQAGLTQALTALITVEQAAMTRQDLIQVLIIVEQAAMAIQVLAQTVMAAVQAAMAEQTQVLLQIQTAIQTILTIQTVLIMIAITPIQIKATAMKSKKDLAQLAFSALLLAATVPVDGQAEIAGKQDTYLAALGGCGASKCGAIGDNGSSYNAGSNTSQTGSYSNTGANSTMRSGSYGSTGGSYTGSDTGAGVSGYGGTSSYGNTGSGYSGTSGYGGSYNTTDTSRTNRDWNTGRATTGSYTDRRMNHPGYSDTYRSSSYDVDADVYPGARPGVRRNAPGEYNRATVSTTTSYATLTEAQLLAMLNADVRAIYISLDAEGKALALQLASQDSYPDKNVAVLEAQRRVNERRGTLSR